MRNRETGFASVGLPQNFHGIMALHFIVAGNPCAKQYYSYLFCKRTGLANLKVPQKPEKEPGELERLAVITRGINNDRKVGEFFPSPETT